MDTRQVEVTDITSEGKAQITFHQKDNKENYFVKRDNRIEAWIDQEEDYVIARSILSPN